MKYTKFEIFGRKYTIKKITLSRQESELLGEVWDVLDDKGHDVCALSYDSQKRRWIAAKSKLLTRSDKDPIHAAKKVIAEMEN